MGWVSWGVLGVGDEAVDEEDEGDAEEEAEGAERGGGGLGQAGLHDLGEGLGEDLHEGDVEHDAGGEAGADGEEAGVGAGREEGDGGADAGGEAGDEGEEEGDEETFGHGGRLVRGQGAGSRRWTRSSSSRLRTSTKGRLPRTKRPWTASAPQRAMTSRMSWIMGRVMRRPGMKTGMPGG